MRLQECFSASNVFLLNEQADQSMDMRALYAMTEHFLLLQDYIIKKDIEKLDLNKEKPHTGIKVVVDVNLKHPGAHFFKKPHRVFGIVGQSMMSILQNVITNGQRAAARKAFKEFNNDSDNSRMKTFLQSNNADGKRIGEVSVSIAESSAEAEDQGDSIPPINAQQMFKSSFTEGLGTGVGLDSIKKQLVNFGGHISYLTEIHKGTKVIVRFKQVINGSAKKGTNAEKFERVFANYFKEKAGASATTDGREPPEEIANRPAHSSLITLLVASWGLVFLTLSGQFFDAGQFAQSGISWVMILSLLPMSVTKLLQTLGWKTGIPASHKTRELGIPGQSMRDLPPAPLLERLWMFGLALRAGVFSQTPATALVESRLIPSGLSKLVPPSYAQSTADLKSLFKHAGQFELRLLASENLGWWSRLLGQFTGQAEADESGKVTFYLPAYVYALAGKELQEANQPQGPGIQLFKAMVHMLGKGTTQAQLRAVNRLEPATNTKIDIFLGRTLRNLAGLLPVGSSLRLRTATWGMALSPRQTWQNLFESMPVMLRTHDLTRQLANADLNRRDDDTPLGTVVATYRTLATQANEITQTAFAKALIHWVVMQRIQAPASSNQGTALDGVLISELFQRLDCMALEDWAKVDLTLPHADWQDVLKDHTLKVPKAFSSNRPALRQLRLLNNHLQEFFKLVDNKNFAPKVPRILKKTNSSA
ncbi:MAG: hypothetical protein HGA76_10730 [Candidatus Firestonebacteria bacterium]|nr:hypothetical protein [Candidatus Firestonebacteria bacterium]